MRDRSNFVKALTPGEVRDEGVDALFMVWLVSRSTQDLVDAVLAPAGLTGDEFALYSMLNATTTTTPTELARWMAAPATTVSSYVKRLERRGHISREPNPSDRRSCLIQLTAEGDRAHRAATELIMPVREQVAAALATDGENVRETLLRLRTVIDNVRHQRGDVEQPA